MSKHLLRKLLNLDTQDTYTDTKTYTKNVYTKTDISNQTFTDDLSDVSSHLLRSIMKKNIKDNSNVKNIKPLTYCSSLPTYLSDKSQTTSYDSFFDKTQ